MPRRYLFMFVVVAVLCLVAAVVVVRISRTDGNSPPASVTGSVAATVTEAGVDLVFDRIRVHGPPGVAPIGAVLTASVASVMPTGQAAALVNIDGAGISLSLGGVQPSVPLLLTFPAPATRPEEDAPVVITEPSSEEGARLIPAAYADGKDVITAEVNHLSNFWLGYFNFDAFGDSINKLLVQTVDISTPRPDCVSKKTIVNAQGETFSLVSDLDGDTPVAWPCLRFDGSNVVADLTSNSPLPWRVRAAPSAILEPQGTLDTSKAIVLAAYQVLITHRPYSEGLLVPAAAISYKFPPTAMPATVAGRADLGTYLGMALLFGVQEVLVVFGVKGLTLATSVEALRCVGDLVETATLSSRPNLDTISSFAKSVLSCVETVATALGDDIARSIKVVIGILGSGISLAVAGFQGAILTVTQKDSFSISISRADRTRAVQAHDLLTAPVPELCQHPSGRLRDGQLPGLGPSDGYEFISAGGPTPFGTTGVAPVLADLTGDGEGDAAAVASCSAGGVSWPDTVLFYGPGTRLLGAADIHSVHPVEHADVQTMSLEGKDIRITWATYEGCCFNRISWTARLHWDGKEVKILDAKHG